MSIEVIEHDGTRYAEIIWADTRVEKTRFFSPPEASFQFGLLAHDAGYRDANLLGKVYFPRFAIPLAKVLSFLIDLLIALGVLGLFVALYGATPSAGLVALPAFLLLAFVTGLGAGTLLATLNVRYRDVTMAIPLIVQLWLFATPVIYPGSLITGDWRYVYALNPMVSVIDGIRWGFLGAPAPEPAMVAVSTASALVLLVAGLVYFRRSERFFANII